MSWPTTSRSPSTPSIHLIITHEVTNVGTDRSQLANVAKETKTTLEATSLGVVADRDYFSSEQILACEEAGITVTLLGSQCLDPQGIISLLGRAGGHSPPLASFRSPVAGA